MFATDGAAELDPFPLKPPDTSSPRDTFQSFLVNINIAIQRHGRRQDYTSRDEWQLAIRSPFEKAMRCLDLSDIGEAFREITGVETVLFLKEIFDRIEIPPYDKIPGDPSAAPPPAEPKAKETPAAAPAPAAAAAPAPANKKPAAAAASTSNSSTEPSPAAVASDAPAASGDGPAAPILRWRVPNTEIVIARVEEGPREGEYLFTKRTVANARAFYQKAKMLAYKPESAFGIYEKFIRAPGAWLDHEILESLPYWMTVIIQDVPVWKWLVTILAVVIGSLAIYLLYRWGKRWDRTHQASGNYWRIGRLGVIAGAIALVVFVEYFIKQQVKVRGIVIDGVQIASFMLITVAIGWAAVLFLSGLAHTIIASRRYAEPSIDAHLVRVCTRLVTFVILTYLVVDATEVLGIPLAPVLAGLGVGGLAVALAARPTLENFIAGIILFIDKPIRVGNFCRYGDKIGTVEEIGLRSTRIRSLDRTVVTVPNADFSQMEIENFAERDQILLRHKFELRRETTADQLRRLVDEVHALLMADERIDEDPCRVRMVGYGQYSVDLEIFAYVHTADINEFFAIREELLLQISEIVERIGTAYAMPVQIHVPPEFGPAAG